MRVEGRRVASRFVEAETGEASAAVHAKTRSFARAVAADALVAERDAALAALRDEGDREPARAARTTAARGALVSRSSLDEKRERRRRGAHCVPPPSTRRCPDAVTG